MRTASPGKPGYKICMERLIPAHGIRSSITIYVEAISQRQAIHEARSGMNTTHRSDCDKAWKVTSISSQPIPAPKP